MRLGRKNYVDEQARIEGHRQKLIRYKKFFHSDEGREVLVDLMDRFSLVFSAKVKDGFTSDRVLGQNDVVAYILGNAEYPMEQFDKIVKGDRS